MSKKNDRVIHFEAAIQRMRFVSLYDAYRFLSDIAGFADDHDGVVSMEDIFTIYHPSLSGVDVRYDYDNAKDWGLSLDRLQHVGVYKAPKSTKLIQTADHVSMNVEFLNGDGYYLVVRGVEDLKNE